MVTDAALPGVDRLRSLRRLHLGLAVLFAVVAGAGLGAAAGALAMANHIGLLGVALGVALPVLIWRRPATAVFVLLIVALFFEQFPLGLADKLTELVPLFKSLSADGLSGLKVNPAELLMAVSLLIWIAKGVAERRLALPRSQLAAAIGVMLLVVLAAEVHGLATGGVSNVSFDEIRPWFYLAATYLLASQLLRRRELIWAQVGLLVVAGLLKGLQAAYRAYATRDLFPRPETLLEHEQAIFFGLAMCVPLGLYLFGIRGRLLRFSLAVAPVAFYADLVNKRRTAWIILAAGVVILLVAAWVRLPRRRRLVGWLGAVIALLGAAYVAVGWHSTSTWAEPAQAVRSAFSPDVRDSSSDLYRVVENINLGYAIKETTPLGLGFGKVLPQTVPQVDLSKIDPFIAYIPHNTVLYVWVRMGFPGALAFWFLVGAAVISCCRLVRHPDRRLAFYGALALCAVAAYLVEGWYDQGLISFRVAIVTGCLLGGVEAAHRLAANAAAGGSAGAESQPETALAA